jgi:hypothetical protein
MNKLFLSIAFASTCLISSGAWANASLGNSVIENHNKNVQENKTEGSSSQANPREPQTTNNSGSLSRTVTDKRKERIDAEPSLQNTNTTPSTNDSINSNPSLGRSAIEKHNQTVDN